MKPILFGTPILFVLMLAPGFAFAHHHGVSPLYRQGEIDGNTLRQNGGSSTFDTCIANFQQQFGLDTTEYCNGFTTGFNDGVIN